MTVQRVGKWLAGLAIVAGIAVAVLAAFPIDALKGFAEQRLSARFGAPVRIGKLERLDAFSLDPRIRIENVRIGQPAWAGTGEFVSIDQAVVRIPLLPMLHGSFKPQSVDVEGLVLNLVRTADGRANWEGRKDKNKRKASLIDHLSIADGRVRLRDDKRHMTLDAALNADAARGLTIVGPGSHRGLPMRFSALGGVIDGGAAGKPWPIQVSLASPLLQLEAQAKTDQPLDLGSFEAVVTASGKDITYLDDIIEAGLPGTQEFSLKATVRRDRPDWNIKAIAGRIGRSNLTGAALVKKRDGRTILDGHLDATTLDFADLASDAGQVRGAAKRRAVGPRIIPDTDIHFEKLGKLDGTLRVSAARLLMGGDSIVQGFRGTLTMDHSLLTLAPLTIQLTRGALAGRVRVDHRAGDPKLTIDLRQRGTYFSDIMGGGGEDIDGSIETRLLLSGTGRDVRAALAGANGRIAMVMRGGTMRKKLAIFASGDVLDSIGAMISGSKTARVPVNCLVADFDVHGGTLTPSALLLDTPIGRADGSGSASLATEQLALAFTGRSKHPDPIQLAAKVRVDGSFSAPHLSLVNAQGQTPQGRGLIGKIGGFLGSLRTRGDTGRGLPIPPANCPALARSALR